MDIALTDSGFEIFLDPDKNLIRFKGRIVSDELSEMNCLQLEMISLA